MQLTKVSTPHTQCHTHTLSPTNVLLSPLTHAQTAHTRTVPKRIHVQHTVAEEAREAVSQAAAKMILKTWRTHTVSRDRKRRTDRARTESAARTIQRFCWLSLFCAQQQQVRTLWKLHYTLQRRRRIHAHNCLTSFHIACMCAFVTVFY